MTNEINNDNKPGNSYMTDSDIVNLNADTLIDAGDAVDVLAEKLTDAMIPGAIMVAILLPLSYLYFKRAESYFADVI